VRKTSPVQSFFSKKFDMISNYKPHHPHNEHRFDLVQSLVFQGVVNMILTPSESDGKTFLLRLLLNSEGVSLNLSDFARNLCKFTFTEDQTWCELQ